MDLRSIILGALSQAGLRDPAMQQQIMAAVMAGMAPPPAGVPPMGPGWSGPAPAERFGYVGQPDRDLLAGASYGRGPAPAPIDPRAESDLMAGLGAEMLPPPGMPPMPGDIQNAAAGPGNMTIPEKPPAPPWSGMLDADEVLGLEKPPAPAYAPDVAGLTKPAAPSEPGLRPREVRVKPKIRAKARKPRLSESDRLNMAELERIKRRRAGGMFGRPAGGMFGG